MIDIGQCVQQARKAKGLKQFELARRAQMCAAQLCQIENGRVSPSFVMVERIAEALDLTIPGLLGGGGRKTAAKARAGGEAPVRAAESRFVSVRRIEPDAAKAIKAVESALGASASSRPPVAAVCTLVFNRARFRFEGAGAALAEELRNDLGLGTAPVGDLASALRFRGVAIVEAKLGKSVSSVALWDRERRAPVVVLNAGATAERRLYRLVYELGSAALYASLGVQLDESLEQHRFLTDFTAAFLMPGASVRTCVAATAIAPSDWSIGQVLPLKAYFGVSAESFLLRLDELGLIMPKRRLALRDRLRAYYKKHPKAMEPQIGSEG